MQFNKTLLVIDKNNYDYATKIVNAYIVYGLWLWFMFIYLWVKLLAKNYDKTIDKAKHVMFISAIK